MRFVIPFLTLFVFAAIVSANVAFVSRSEKDELAELRADVKQLKSTVTTLKAEASQKGVTYTRWGRRRCEYTGAQLLYRGYAAGPRWSDKGGGSNTLCLNERPQWKNRVAANHHNWRGVLTGAETWFTYAGDLFSLKNNGGYSLDRHPAPCAVCYVPTRTAQVMIPARLDCPAGWTREYGGYLVSDHTYSNRVGRTSHICYDEAPETAAGGYLKGQSLVFPVLVSCGTLPCSLFRNDWPVTCVVCTK